jgi:hypothetical protein
MLLSGLGPAPRTYDLPPIRVLAERRETTLHAPRLTLHAPRLTPHAYSCKGPGVNLQWCHVDEVVEDVFPDE